MTKTADRTSARNRARQALADKQQKRRERDERMEAAATKYFAAADAIERAQREAGEALQALVDEGEPRGEIAELLGITTREIKQSLDAISGTAANDEERDGVVSASPEVAESVSTDSHHVS